MEPLYHIGNPGFEAVIFRRIYRQISGPGGLWDRSMEMYPQVGGRAHFSGMYWDFPSGARIRFSHMQYEHDCFSWKGSEITLIEFDELTDFSQYQVWYMLSRNRSLCGIKPYMRGYTNPDSESWVRELLAPWVDPSYPDPAKSGEIRWFVRKNGLLEWCEQGTPMAKSLTFVAANIFDNKVLMEKDPNYVSNLSALPEVERQRLLLGNWTVRPSGNKFKREWFPIVQEPPADLVKIVRFWDLAATEVEDEVERMQHRNLKDGPDYTAGVKVGITAQNTYIVLDAVWFRKSPRGIDTEIRRIAEHDGTDVEVYMEEEPGASGIHTTNHFRLDVLPGWDFHVIRQSKSKVSRGNIVASMCEGHAVSLLQSWWNDPFLNFLVAFPNEKVHDDPPDALFSAMMVLFSGAGDVPVAISGQSKQAMLPAPQHAPTEDQSEEERERLLTRQASAARIMREMQQLTRQQAKGGDWLG